MKKRIVPLPELGLLAGTRAIAGAGIGLLLAGRMEAPRRRQLGWALLTVGALSTIPLVLDLLRRPGVEDLPGPNGRNSVGAQRMPAGQM